MKLLSWTQCSPLKGYGSRWDRRTLTPYWDRWIEQIALSDSGRWFRRIRPKDKPCWKRWKEVEETPLPMQRGFSVYGPWSRPLTPEEAAKLPRFTISASVYSAWRDPTEEECVNAIKGGSNALKLLPGPYRIQLPETFEERLARQERRQLSALAPRSPKAKARAL
jgi:hypothetical protein